MTPWKTKTMIKNIKNKYNRGEKRPQYKGKPPITPGKDKDIKKTKNKGLK